MLACLHVGSLLMITRNLAIGNRSRVESASAHEVTTVLKWPLKVTQGHRKRR